MLRLNAMKENIKNAYSFRANALLAENNEIADQMVQLHQLICYFVVLLQLLMGFCRVMLHPN